MTLSVGLGRIVNDPEASILTRKALGRLETPGLLVTDEGLTINNDGRMVLRLTQSLSQDGNGLAVRISDDGGIVLGDDGLEIGPFENLVCDNIIVNQNAAIGGVLAVEGDANFAGDAAIGGDFFVSGALNAIVINSTTIINSGNISSDTANFAGAVSVGGVLSSGDINSSGNIVAFGVTAVGILADGIVASNSISSAAGSFSGNVLIGGTLGVTGATTLASVSATSAAVSGNATVGGSATITGAVNAATGVIGANQLTALGLISGNINANNILAFVNLETPKLRISSGTNITRVLSFFTTVFIPALFGTFDFFVSTPGSSGNDCVIVNPISPPDNTFDSWSGSTNGNGSVLLRIQRDGLTTFPATSMSFRITVIGFL